MAMKCSGYEVQDYYSGCILSCKVWGSRNASKLGAYMVSPFSRARTGACATAHGCTTCDT